MTGSLELPLRTPVSDSMYHAEVLGLAKTWLEECKCAVKTQPRREDYPTRLIDLADLKVKGTIDTEKWKYRGGSGLNELLSTEVRLVDTADLDWQKLKDSYYVSLSHKWGGTDRPVRLTTETEGQLREGIILQSLPRTFQDAILFALRVHIGVHYIWIDSLCIRQGDPEDWLKESARMQDVYRNSFLNISATAAEHGDEGLFSEREPRHLWEDVVNVNINGLHKTNQPTSQASPDVQPVRSCLLIDVLNWETLVNQAPVNKRGWVVQERLLAPRVLHFCRGRIAWECAEFEDIEGHVPQIPNYQLVGDEILEAIPTKGLDPGEHGKRLRHNRFRGRDDPLCLNDDDQRSRVIRSLELWAHVVEMYSRTNLTQKNDKLIALSGIANGMASIIGNPKPFGYIAGLWDVHLVSQLLWYIEPVFRGASGSGTGAFEYPSRRPPQYRAPSFSWASVDAQYGNGITYGEVLDGENDFVKIHGWEVHLLKTENKFGLVEGGHLQLWAHVHKVKLHREHTNYLWHLHDGNEARAVPGKRFGVCAHCAGGGGEESAQLRTETHLNVRLDCPGDDDQNDRLTKCDEIYCIPMGIGPSHRSDEVICLLLERVPGDTAPQIPVRPTGYQNRTFRRIGLTKLTTSFDHFTMSYVLEKVENRDGDATLLHQNTDLPLDYNDGGYCESTGRHLICII